jgi:hypothetical protein
VLKFSDFLILLGIVLGVIVTGVVFLLVLLYYNRHQRPREHKAMPLNPPMPYHDISQQASVDTSGMSPSFTCTIGPLTFPKQALPSMPSTTIGQADSIALPQIVLQLYLRNTITEPSH